MRFRRRADSESLYRQGVDRWASRDLGGAKELLDAALDASPGPLEDHWWFSASRALAQVALEQGDVEAAWHHLSLLPGHGVGNAQQEALRSKTVLMAGNDEEAALHVSVAVAELGSDLDGDVGTLMNGAIALLWCGEVLVDLGYGREAARLTDMARARIHQAGVQDAVLEGGLAMVAAGAARLGGDLDGARAALATIDRTVSPDFGFQMTTESARLVWMEGDQLAARERYAAAAAEAEALTYPAVVARLLAEAETGPGEARGEPRPVEEWAQRNLEEELAGHRPYAVVVRLVMEIRPADAYLEVVRRVEELMEANPGLGRLDGWGTVEDIWEMFLEGEDPGALWEAVGPLVVTLAGPGSEVELRRDDDGVESRPLR